MAFAVRRPFPVMLFVACYSSESHSRSHSAAEASDGMRQSPRGESETRSDLGTVGHGRALELLGKEAAEEDP